MYWGQKSCCRSSCCESTTLLGSFIVTIMMAADRMVISTVTLEHYLDTSCHLQRPEKGKTADRISGWKEIRGPCGRRHLFGCHSWQALHAEASKFLTADTTPWT